MAELSNFIWLGDFALAFSIVTGILAAMIYEERKR